MEKLGGMGLFLKQGGVFSKWGKKVKKIFWKKLGKNGLLWNMCYTEIKYTL